MSCYFGGHLTTARDGSRVVLVSAAVTLGRVLSCRIAHGLTHVVSVSHDCAVSVAGGHTTARDLTCRVMPVQPAQGAAWRLPGRRSSINVRSASACAQTGWCELCSRAMKNACMQIATAHGVSWACVLAGFYSVSGVDEIALQRVARSAFVPPKPPGAPLPDDA